MPQAVLTAVALTALLLSPWLVTAIIDARQPALSETHRLTRAVLPPQLHEHVRITGHAGREFEHLGEGEYKLRDKLVNGWAYTHIRCEQPHIAVQVWTHADGRAHITIGHLPDHYGVRADNDTVVLYTQATTPSK